MSSPLMHPAAGRQRGPIVVPPMRRKASRIVVMQPTPSPEPPTPARAMRRPSPRQGRALELLGRAIEYLVDENVHYGHIGNRGEAMDSEAVQLLMKLNRAVFAECEVVVPLGARLRNWVMGCVAA